MEARWSTTSVCNVSFWVCFLWQQTECIPLGLSSSSFNSCLFNWKILLYTNEPKSSILFKVVASFSWVLITPILHCVIMQWLILPNFFYGDLVAHPWWNGYSCFRYLILNDSWHVFPFMFIGLINIFCHNWRSHYKLDI